MKTTAIWLFAPCLALSLFAARATAARPGGPQGASVADKDVVKAAQFAVAAQQKAMRGTGTRDKLTLTKIVSAKKQVVAGTNFLLTLEVREGSVTRTADATVWWQAWREDPYRLTSWKFTDDSNTMTFAPLASNNEAVTANNSFAIDLYLQLAKDAQGKNVFFSPYSMSSALAMTAEGARGETAAQMGKVLCFPESARHAGDDNQPWNMAVIHTGIAALNGRFNPKPVSQGVRDKIAALRKDLDETNRKAAELQRGNSWREGMDEAAKAQKIAAELNAMLAHVDLYELRVANALWGEKTYPFSPAYLETVHKYYGGGAFPVDFKNKAEGERQKINAWVEDQTNQRIKDLIPAGCIDALTRLVLTNAIYFKGEWKEPFEASLTKEDDFIAAGEKLRVPLMYKGYLRDARYAAFNSDGTSFDTPKEVPAGPAPDPATVYPGKGGFVLAELPYKGGDLAMVAILPQDADGLPELEKKLSGENVQSWLSKLQARTVHVYLPKFKLETSYGMNDALSAMGMPRAFVDPSKPNGAQFDGMTTSADLEHKLFIGAVLHKAFVDVNEKGTEAAAATAVLMPAAAAFRPPKMVPFIPTFRADHPFLFAIRDVKTGTLLFLGRLTSPKR
jgi:serine protease inhibitor